MSDFRVRPGKPVARELARVITAQTARARALLADEDAEPERVVHEVRRRLKKVRAAARMAREVDEPLAHAINAAARSAARMLSGTRDADVVRAAAEGLAESVDDEDVAITLRGFAAHAARAAPAEEDRKALAAEASATLKRTLASARRLASEHAPRKALKRAAKRVLRRAERAFLAAHAAAAPEEVRHEWRKRVKELWYIERLLRDVWPLKRRAKAAQVDTLGKRLGEERDLLLLASRMGRCARACGGAAARDRALAYIESRRTRIVAETRALGEDVHDREPA